MDLLDTHLDLLDIDLPSILKMSLRQLLKTSSKHVFKAFSRHLEDQQMFPGIKIFNT